MGLMYLRVFVAMALGFSFACATTGSVEKGTEPDDMSAEEHRRMAEQHEGRAMAAEMAGTRGVQAPTSSSDQWGPNRAQESMFSQGRNSFEHRVHAQQHREAARLLEVFEDAACMMLDAAQRSVCPLLEHVQRVEEVPQGVRLVLTDAAKTAEFIQRMRCHHAFGKSHGYRGMNDCPLYIKRLNISEAGVGVVEITSTDSMAVPEIRRRAYDHVRPKNTPAASQP